MKKDLSSLEIHYLVKELNKSGITESKINRIFQPEEKTVLLDLFASGKGKILLKIMTPNFMFISSEKGENPQNPFNFCMVLRKYITNARVDKIEQVGSERIVKFSIRTKEKNFHLYVELFSKGNIVLCDDKDMIISAIEKQIWKTRSVKKDEAYIVPSRGYNFFTLNEDELKDVVEKTTKDHLIAILAMDLGIGGTYSEEICTISGLNKNLETGKIDVVKIRKIIEAIKDVTSRKMKPFVIKRDDNTIDAIPFELELYKYYDKEEKETFSSAIDAFVSTSFDKTAIHKRSKYEDKIKELERLIAKQEEQLKRIEEEQDENRKKGELMYEQYQLINEILVEIRKAREKYSWKEIKEKLKGHKIIKDINEKEGKITAEI